MNESIQQHVAENNNRCLNRISTLTHDDGSIQRIPHPFGGEKAHERIEKTSVSTIEVKHELSKDRAK